MGRKKERKKRGQKRREKQKEKAEEEAVEVVGEEKRREKREEEQEEKITMKSRGFEIITEYQEKGINIPERQTKGSAGYDLASAVDYTIEPKKVALIPTGLKMYMQEDEVVYIYPRSSVAIKQGLVMPNSAGIIDSDYYNNPKNEGHVHIALYNITDEAIEIKKGLDVLLS